MGYLYNVKDLIRKILKEELSDFDWALDNSIDGKELRELILKEKGTTIPFEKVGGDLDLKGTQIESLGNLQSVGGDLYLFNTPIESLGNLTSVGGNLNLRNTSITKKYTKREEIRQMVNVGGDIYL